MTQMGSVDFKVSPHFSYFEMRCPLTHDCDMDAEFMVMLERMREFLGHKIPISSGYRSEDQNNKVGGSKSSWHLYGKAVDIPVTSDKERFELVAAAIKAGMKGIGVYKAHIHVDYRTGNKRVLWWG